MSGPSQPVQVFVNQPRGNGLAVASLVFGALATVLCCIPILPWVLAAFGIIFGILAGFVAIGRGGQGLGMAVGGLVLCVISLAPIILLGGLIFGTAASNVMDASRRADQARMEQDTAEGSAAATTADSQEQTPVEPVFDVPTLCGKSIDEVRDALGPPEDLDKEPDELQGSLAVVEWENTWTRRGQELSVTFDGQTREVMDFFLPGSDRKALMQAAGLADGDPRYRVEPVPAVIDPSTITGIKVIPTGAAGRSEPEMAATPAPSPEASEPGPAISPVPAVRPPEKFRTWSDATGQFSIEAEFVSMVAGKVKLRKRDGSTIEIPMDKLSEADQAWVKQQAYAR